MIFLITEKYGAGLHQYGAIKQTKTDGSSSLKSSRKTDNHMLGTRLNNRISHVKLMHIYTIEVDLDNESRCWSQPASKLKVTLRVYKEIKRKGESYHILVVLGHHILGGVGRI